MFYIPIITALAPSRTPTAGFVTNPESALRVYIPIESRCLLVQKKNP